MSSITYGEGYVDTDIIGIIPKCAIQFFPCDSYDGEYGFDTFDYIHLKYIKRGDFNGVIGYYKDRDGKVSGNAEGKDTFSPDNDLLQKYKNTYTKIPVRWKNPMTYYVPRMTLMKFPTMENNATLQMELFLEDENKKPEKFVFEFDDKNLCTENGQQSLYLNINQQASLTIPCTTTLPLITISCNRDFRKTITLNVFADNSSNPENLCGALQILPNLTDTYKKMENIVVVNVKTNIDGKKEPKTGFFPIGEYQRLKNILRQAYIDLPNKTKIPEITINCADAAFKNRYSVKGEMIDDNGKKIPAQVIDFTKMPTDNEAQNQKEFLNYLKAKADKQHDEDQHPERKAYYHLFFVNEYCTKLGGFASLGINLAVCFNLSMEEYTVAHEFLHSLGLTHSFDYTHGDYAYQQGITDNVMDYSYASKRLYFWQWKKLNPDIRIQ